MLVTSCIMELRSRLRSCNVYITTSVDLRKNSNLKINIQADTIILNYYPNVQEREGSPKSARSESISSISSYESSSDVFTDEEFEISETIPIDEFCRIIPNSMSGLKVDKTDISFRILTEPKTGGDFYKEVLPPQKELTMRDRFGLSINIAQNDELQIVCANCYNVITDGFVKFNRVLELPSENLDVSEWFCHGHGSSHGHGSNHSHDHGSNHSDDHSFSVKPNKYDLLYRLCFFLVNVTVLSDKLNKFNTKRDIYHCNRCLAWLGTKSQDRSSVKFYNSTTQLKRVVDGYTTLFKYKDPPLNDSVCNDFIFLIERVTKEFNLGMQYAIMCKLLLECVFSSTCKQYILVWIMDRELQVLKSVIEDENDESIKLVSGFSTKILYRVEDSRTEVVESWSSEPGVVCTEIAKNMFQSGVKHLQYMSTKVPESFRSSNGFYVSYLNM